MEQNKREIAVEEYARKILAEHGCNEYTYGDEPVETVLQDLKDGYPNGMDFPYVEVANAIKRISKPHLIKRKPFCVVWDCDSFTDGMECDTFEEAKEDAIETLLQWQIDTVREWKPSSCMSMQPSEEEKENWDYMIYNSISYVQKYNESTDEYEDYWYPSDDELKEINWCLWDERK